MFLHGSLMHLAINMYSLYSAGSMVEILCGRKKHLAIYLLCGLAGSAACQPSKTLAVEAEQARSCCTESSAAHNYCCLK